MSSPNKPCPTLLPPPPEVKPLLPFLQRAQEMAQRDPVISFWCKMHVVQSAFRYTTDSPQIKSWLRSLIDILEWEKAALAQEEAVTNKMVAQAHVENFAYQIFSIADNEDREGKATLRTAKIFLAASHYLEVVASLFSKQDTDEIKEKIKYAKWKAASLLKSPPSSSSTSTASSLPSDTTPLPSSSKPSQNDVSFSFSSTSYNPLPPTLVSPPSTSSTSSTVSAPTLETQVLSEAQKSARFVISALEYEDIPTAVLYLEKALALLQPYVIPKSSS